jgi:hypothetical protein
LNEDGWRLPLDYRKFDNQWGTEHFTAIVKAIERLIHYRALDGQVKNDLFWALNKYKK